MPANLPAENILGRVPHKRGQRTLRPLPPPGNWLDGQPHGEHSALFAASKQTTVITLGGTTATGDTTVLTITPTRTAHGSPWADSIPALVIEVETGVTETLTALGELIEARAAAIVALSSLTDHTDWQPIRDFMSITAAAGVITLVTRDAGARFTYSFSNDGSTTETGASTGTTDDELRVGTVVVKTSLATNGYPNIAAPVAGSAASAIFGVVAEQNACAATSSGYTFKVIPAGNDVVVQAWGNMTAYCEGAASADGQVYVRKTATGTEISGALAGTATTDTPEVYTITPTPAHSTLFSFGVEVLDFFTGAVVQKGRVSMTSDGTAIDSEIVTGWKTSLADDNDQLDDYIAGTGTTTLILTVTAGYKLAIYPDSPGAMTGYDAPSTAGLSDHLLWPGAKFLETTTAAGIQAISVPHP